MKKSLLNLFCSVIFLSALASAALADYSLEYLGLPAKPDGLCPYFVTSSGTVAGHYSKGGMDTQAFIWKDGRVHDLTPPEGYKYVFIEDANNQGQVLASVSKVSGEPEACLYELAKDGTVTAKMISYPGKGRSTGRCIGDDGQIAGMNGALKAFVWKDGTAKLLPPPAGVTDTEACAANDISQVAGNVRTTSDKALSRCALLWSNDTVKVVEKPEGCDHVQPMFLNNKGEMILRGGKTGSSALRWFFWSDAGMKEILLPQEITYSVITGFNDRGEAIGEFRYAGKTYAIVWQNGQLRYLATLRQSPGELERAWAINNRGQIVGNSTGIRCGMQAVLWQDGAVVVLPSPANGRSLSSVAHYINDAGVILGKVEVERGQWQIVLWRPTR